MAILSGLIQCRIVGLGDVYCGYLRGSMVGFMFVYEVWPCLVGVDGLVD